MSYREPPDGARRWTGELKYIPRAAHQKGWHVSIRE